MLILGPRDTPRAFRRDRPGRVSIENSSFSHPRTRLDLQCSAIDPGPKPCRAWGPSSGPQVNPCSCPPPCCLPATKRLETGGFRSSGFLTYSGQLRMKYKGMLGCGNFTKESLSRILILSASLRPSSMSIHTKLVERLQIFNCVETRERESHAP